MNTSVTHKLAYWWFSKKTHKIVTLTNNINAPSLCQKKRTQCWPKYWLPSYHAGNGSPASHLQRLNGRLKWTMRESLSTRHLSISFSGHYHVCMQYTVKAIPPDCDPWSTKAICILQESSYPGKKFYTCEVIHAAQFFVPHSIWMSAYGNFMGIQPFRKYTELFWGDDHFIQIALFRQIAFPFGTELTERLCYCVCVHFP